MAQYYPTTLGRIILLVAGALVLGSCGSNTEATKQKLLDSGNEYFEQGRYREAAIIYGRAVQQDRRFGPAYFQLAKAEIRLGRIAEAARSLHRATELQPKNAEAFSMLSEIYLAAIGSDVLHRDLYLRELGDLVEMAERRGTDPFEVLRIRGYFAMEEGKPDDAAEHFRQALARKPGEKRLQLAVVRALRAGGRLDEARRLARKELEADPEFAAMYDRLYTILLRQGEERQAERLIETKCREMAENPGCRLQLAAHYHRVEKNNRRDAVLEDLVPDDSQDIALIGEVANFYERIRGFERALHYWRRALKVSSAGQSYYQLRITNVLASAGRTAEALQLVESVLAEEPEHPEALALRAAIQLYGGDPAAVRTAISTLEETIALLPKNAVLRYNLGMAYFSVKDIDRATVQFQEAAAMLPGYEAPRFRLGQLYLLRGQPAMAAQLADEVLKLNPLTIRGRLLRADASIRLQEPNQARSHLDYVLEREPANHDAQYLMAALSMAERRYADAETILRRLYRQSPDDSRGIRGLVGVFVAQGKEREALSMLERELEKNPNNRQLRLVSANVAMDTEDYSHAIAQYDEILAQDPEQANVHVSIGMAYYGAGELGKAEDHFQRARQAEPGNMAANLRLSMLVGELGRYNQAREILESVLKTAPDNPIALNNMAYILAESDQTRDTAQTLAQRAVNRAQGNNRIRDSISETLAYIYLRKNLHDNAIEIYEQIVARNPDNGRWRYRYAQALYQKGNMVEARSELEQALATRPPKREADQMRALLAQVSR